MGRVMCELHIFIPLLKNPKEKTSQLFANKIFLLLLI